MSSFKVLGVLAAVVLIGLLFGWLGTRNSAVDALPPAGTPTPPPAPAPTPKPDPFFTVHPRGSHPEAPPAEAPAPPPAPTLLTNWQDRVDGILTSQSEDSAKVKEMLAMFPRLPEMGQVEVAQHLSNLVTDQEYGPMGQYLTNTALPDSVLDVLLSDLMNRPSAVKLPLLLEVAREPKNPKAGEAKDLLGLFLQQDYGTDWDAWQTNIAQWLKDNPD